MPKDPTRNIDSYKIRGGQLNQYDYARHHTELAQEHQENEESGHEQQNPLPFTPEQKKVDRVRELLTRFGESLPSEKKALKAAKTKAAKDVKPSKKSGESSTSIKAASKKSRAAKKAAATINPAKPVKPVKKAGTKSSSGTPTSAGSKKSTKGGKQTAKNAKK